MAQRTAKAKSVFLAFCMVGLFSMQIAPAYAFTLHPLAVGTVGNSGAVVTAALQCKSVQKAIKNGISSIIGFFGGNSDAGEADQDATAQGAASSAADFLSTATTQAGIATSVGAGIAGLATAASTAIAGTIAAKATLDTIGSIALVAGTTVGNPQATTYDGLLALSNAAVASLNAAVLQVTDAAQQSDSAANHAFQASLAAESIAAQTTDDDDPTNPADAAEIAADNASAVAAAASADAASTASQTADIAAAAAKTAQEAVLAANADATTSVTDQALIDQVHAAVTLLTGIDTSLNSIKSNTNSAQASSKTTAAATNNATNQTTCFQKIERAAAQVVLKTLTKDTITWINSGFHGKPLYIQDTSTFLKQIRDQEVGTFTTNLLSDAGKYPFGKLVAKGLISDTNSYFEKADQYSLDKVIAEQVPGATPLNFQQNFGNGGWSAFSAQFNDQNNPIGFSLAAKSALASRIGDTAYSPAQDIKDQLKRNSGFLDLKSCVNPANSDLEYPDPTCKQWQTDTPGSVIVNKLDSTLNSPLEQLSLGNDITTDLIAVINAVLNQGVKYSLKQINTNSL